MWAPLKQESLAQKPLTQELLMRDFVAQKQMTQELMARKLLMQELLTQEMLLALLETLLGLQRRALRVNLLPPSSSFPYGDDTT